MIDRDRFHFVLVRPTYLGNIGSATRVLKNFGFKNLRLVSAPKNYKDAEARKMSVGAFDLLKAALCFDSVQAAVQDMSLIVGTTCAYQRDCKPDFLDEVSGDIKARTQDQIAILFGDERDGLTREELEYCHYVISIPTENDFPSLNVAQALGLFAYELIRRDDSNRSEIEAGPSMNEVDEYFLRLSSYLSTVGFTKSFSEERILKELRGLFNKSRPSAREMKLLTALLWKIEQMSSDSSGLSQEEPSSAKSGTHLQAEF